MSKRRLTAASSCASPVVSGVFDHCLGAMPHQEPHDATRIELTEHGGWDDDDDDPGEVLVGAALELALELVGDALVGALLVAAVLDAAVLVGAVLVGAVLVDDAVVGAALVLAAVDELEVVLTGLDDDVVGAGVRVRISCGVFEVASRE